MTNDFLSLTLRANALNEQVGLLPNVPGGQADGWNQYVVEASGLAALLAFEMHMVVVVVVFFATVLTQCVFGIARIVQHLVYDAFIYKRAEGTVYRHAVVVGTKTLLNLAVRQGVVARQKQVEHFHTVARVAQVVVFKRFGSGHGL
jgi:hypothetical protein